MFFRHHKPHVDTFEERIGHLQQYGLAAERAGAGGVRVSRNGIGAVVRDVAGSHPGVEKAGLIMGQEIGELVNGGYQQYWLAPNKKRLPAQAAQLKELHAFEEDLKEGLGLTSLYNTSLGTVSALHLYDRVEERDGSARLPKPWERAK